MYITACPICGKQPKIDECVRYKNNRRRLCGCPNYDSILPGRNGFTQSFFIYVGDGDDNDIYKLWNAAVEYYNKNKDIIKCWSYKVPAWENNFHIEK